MMLSVSWVFWSNMFKALILLIKELFGGKDRIQITNLIKTLQKQIVSHLINNVVMNGSNWNRKKIQLKLSAVQRLQNNDS